MSYFIWPGIYIATFYGTYILRARGTNPMTATAWATLALALVLLIAERLVPSRRDWQAADGQLGTDIGHLIGFILGTMAATWGATVGLAACSKWISAQGGVWPMSWPMPAQLALALVLGDLGNYWQHRLVHGTPWLWRFHAIHHQPRRLALIKTTRNHALDIATGTFLMLTPAVAFGASIELVACLTLFINIGGMVQHVNLHLPTLAICDGIFSTPKNHHAHHSRDRIAGNSNYSMNGMLSDHLFGTFYRASSDSPDRVGIDGDDGSQPFWSQVLTPLRRYQRQ